MEKFDEDVEFEDNAILLSDEQFDKHLASGAHTCPNCNSQAIESDIAEWDGDSVWIPYVCQNCLYSWNPVFKVEKEFFENSSVPRNL